MVNQKLFYEMRENGRRMRELRDSIIESANNPKRLEQPLRFSQALYSVMSLGGRNPQHVLALTGKLTSGVYVVPIYIEFSYDVQSLIFQAGRFNHQLKVRGKLHPPPYRESWLSERF